MHKHNHIRVVLSVALITVSFLTVAVVRAQDSLPWINSALLIQKQADSQALPISLNGNIDCALENGTSCAVPTTYGAATQQGTARLNGTPAYRPVLSYIDGRQHFLPIPNSSTVITYTTEPVYGFYLYFNYNFSSSIVKSMLPGSTQTAYKIINPPDAKLVDKSNQRLAADYTSISFSENGQWMVVSEPNVAMLRVNLNTFEVLPFADGFNYSVGLDPAVKTTISNNGRYAVVASQAFGRFKMYDLSTCDSTLSIITGRVSCQSRDLGQFMQQQVPGYNFISSARFSDDNILAVYATYESDQSDKTARFIISAAGNITNQIVYLAVGDSYIAGEGAFGYQGGTDTNDNKCHLSYLAYPYLIGHDLNYDSYHSVACSGAVTRDITDTSMPYGSKKPQAKGKEYGSYDDEIFASFLPGYRAQINFVARYQPKIINLSIGGNDVGFSDIVKRCAEPWHFDTCFSTYEDRLELVREINNKFPDLVDTYQKLKNASAPDTRIYVVGYPQIAKPDGACALNVHLNSHELIFVGQWANYLDRVIERAAAKAGVAYVDTEDALDGHRLCEAKPGSVAMNGLTAGNDAPDIVINGPLGNESFHPNELGYQLLENKILTVTHHLTNPMPAPNPSAVPPSELGGLPILQVPASGRTVNISSYDDSLTSGTVFMGAKTTISVPGQGFSLKPNTNYGAELHSAPVNLGTYSTDAAGNLNTQVQIPANVPPGMHTLHVYGKNIADEPIDIYKTIYVATSQDDLDGDGLANVVDPCSFTDSSYQDYDQDGIDDACDGDIGAAPTLAATENTQNSLLMAVQSSALSISLSSSTQASSGGGDNPGVIQVGGISPKVESDSIFNPNASSVNLKPKVAKIYPDQRPILKSVVVSAGLILPSLFAVAAWKFRD